MRGVLWREDEIEAAVGWRRAGLKTVSIARRLGRSVAATRAKLGRVGEPAPPRLRAAALEAAVRAGWGPGVPDRVLAEVAGVSVNAAYKARRRLGLPAGTTAADKGVA
jgi:hypothetical protein